VGVDIFHQKMFVTRGTKFIYSSFSLIYQFLATQKNLFILEEWSEVAKILKLY